MKKVCVVGHFGFGKNLLNGQTIKTKIVTKALVEQLGESEVHTIDTHGGAKVLPRCFFQIGKAFKNCKNIIMLPAHNGVKFLSPIMLFWRLLFHKRIHYVVIGGWLPELLKSNNALLNMLKKFDGIYVETNTMKKTLEEQGFGNIHVMPNFKDLRILTKKELVFSTCQPYKLCTFSRVMKEKGIEDAVEAVKVVNEKLGRVVYTLDIYGQVDSNQVEWFENMQASFPDYIKYRGLVSFDQSVEVLKEYYALLFPTYYEGEGFAGTLLDAMAAGIPVIASDWKYNKEIVAIGRTGYLFEVGNQNEFQNILVDGSDEKWNSMKDLCIYEAECYRPEKIIKILIKELCLK